MMRTKILTIPRQVLLIEIDRHCFFPDCKARMLIGLTKIEAQQYSGFECSHCSRWNDDQLQERDVPEWWHEIVQPETQQ